MPTRHHALLIGHGALIFILGLVAGVPFVWAIADAATGAPEAVESLRAWRMAHLEGALTISAKQSGLITWGLLVTGWGNILASFVSGLTGGRGLSFTGFDWNTLTFTLFSAAIVGVLIALIVLAVAAFTQKSD